MSDRLERSTGWAVSVGLHALLALIFFTSRVELRPFELEFTPITFSSMSQMESGSSASLADLQSGSPAVELPRRPMLDETSSLLRLPDRDRPAIAAMPGEEKPDFSAVRRSTVGERVNLLPSSAGQRQRAPIEPLPLGDEVLAGIQREMKSERLVGDEMFSISWVGSARIKISGTLPQFPAGVNQAATVKFEIEVDRDGNVAYMAPLTKGLPELEKVSIDALRTWRFNALDRALPQTRQKGYVTFIFQLK